MHDLFAHGPYQAERPAEPLPALDAADLTPEALLEGTARFRRPLVIRGFFSQTRACQLWTPEHLVELLGEEKVPVLDSRAAAPTGDRSHGMLLLTLKEYLDRMASERLYLNNVTRLFNSCPQLIEDLELGRVLSLLPPGTDDDDRIPLTGVFIGARHVGSSLHAAFNGNFFANIQGRKRWVLIDPVLSPYLMPIWASPFLFVSSHFDYVHPEHDFLKRLPRYEVVLEPGDLLYNAPWWWHDVRNLDDYTVGCALRYRPGSFPFDDPSFSNRFLYTALSLYPLGNLNRAVILHKRRKDKSLPTYREQMNKRYDDAILGGIDQLG